MKTKCFTRNLWLFLGLSFILLNHVNAADTTFTFGRSDSNQANIVKTVDGIVMTISNGSDGNFKADDDGGLLVLANNSGFNVSGISISSFDIVFSKDVKLISYNVSYVDGLDDNEVITFTDNSLTSTESHTFNTGSRNFATQISVPANTTISVTTTEGNDDGDLMQISSLVVRQITIPVWAVHCATQKCLKVTTSSSLQVSSCQTADQDQQWKADVSTQPNSIKINSKNVCLDMLSDKSAITSGCSDFFQAQKWNFSASGQVGSIKNSYYTTTCIKVDDDGTTVSDETCDAGNKSQSWEWVKVGDKPKACPPTSTSSSTTTAPLVSTPLVSITLSRTGTGDGTFSFEPTGTKCGPSCMSYPPGTRVAISAHPVSSRFKGWGTHECAKSVVIVDKNMECTAEFESLYATSTILPNQMGVFVEVDGNGTVTSKPYGISCKTSDCEKLSYKKDPTGLECNDSCKAIFDTATWISLNPTPSAGYEFIGWGGHKDCVDNKLFLISNRLCKAYFRTKPSTTTPVNITTQTARLVNLNSRALVDPNAQDFAVGFRISGNGKQTVMLQGIAQEEQIDTVLVLQSFPDNETIASNDNWQEDVRSNEIPTDLQPLKTSDAGILVDLSPGLYITTMSSETTGLGLIAINAVPNSASNIVNLSTRASIQGESNDIIAGFIIEGTGTQKVMIGGFGLEEDVDTTLAVQTDDGTEIAINHDWEEDAQAANIPEDLKPLKATDAGLLLDLPAGNYTAILSTNKGLGLISIDKVE